MIPRINLILLMFNYVKVMSIFIDRDAKLKAEPQAIA
jgi:hypothetical protein